MNLASARTRTRRTIQRQRPVTRCPQRLSSRSPPLSVSDSSRASPRTSARSNLVRHRVSFRVPQSGLACCRQTHSTQPCGQTGTNRSAKISLLHSSTNLLVPDRPMNSWGHIWDSIANRLLAGHNKLLAAESLKSRPPGEPVDHFGFVDWHAEHDAWYWGWE